MKSVSLYGIGDLRNHEESIPVVGAGEKLVRVESVDVCGSVPHWFSEDSIGDAGLEHSFMLEHEFVGETEDGQRAVIDPVIACGHCEYCEHGHHNLCENIIFAGHGRHDGALREYASYPTRYLFPLPDFLSFAGSAMLEPLGVAIHTVDLGKLEAEMTVSVFGCGMIALLIIKMAKLSGAANIIATDKLAHRIEAAKGFGACQVFDAGDGSWLSQIRVATNRRGVDVAFEAARTQGAVDDAFAAVCPGEKVILAGISDDDGTSFTASVARRKGLTIKLVRRMKYTYPRAIELVSKGLVDVRSLVTHRFSLEQASKAFPVAQRREGLKIIMEV